MALFLVTLAAPVADAQVDPRAREPDLQVPGTVTTLDLDDGLVVGSRDPGTRLTGGDPAGGAPDIPVWHLFSRAGEAEAGGRADFFSGSDDCEDRILDDCSGHVVGIGIAGERIVVVSQLPMSPSDDIRGMIQLIDRDAGVGLVRHLEVLPVRAAVSADGKVVAVLGSIPQLAGAESRLLTFQEGNTSFSLVSQHDMDGAPRSLVLSSDGDQAVVLADQAHRLFVGDTASKLLGPASAGAIAADQAHHVVVGTADGDVRLFRQEQEASLFTRRPGSAVTAVAVTHDGMVFAAGDDQGRVHLFRRTPDNETAAAPFGSLDVGDAAIGQMQWSDDGLLLSVAAGPDVHLVQRTGSGASLLWSDTVGGPVQALALSPDGDQVAAAWGNQVRVYEASLQVQGAAMPLTILPGRSENATVVYTNTGNRATDISLSLRVPDDWNATLSQDSVHVPVAGSAEVRVQVTGPSHGRPATGTIWVDHHLDGRVAGTALKAIVAEVHDLRMRPTGAESADVSAGGSHRFRLLVENHGNVPEAVTLALAPSPGWDASLSERSFTIPPGEEQALTLDLQAPSDAQEGDKGHVEVSMAGAPASNIRFTAAVGARFGIDLTVPAEVPFVPGNVTSFKVALHNTGNIIDGARLTIAADAIPPGWAVQLENGLLEQEVRSIKAGETKLVEVHVQSPPGLPSNGFLQIPFVAVSLGDEAREDRAAAMLKVAGPVEPEEDTPAWPLGLLVVGVLWAAGRLRTRP